MFRRNSPRNSPYSYSSPWGKQQRNPNPPSPRFPSPYQGFPPFGNSPNFRQNYQITPGFSSPENVFSPGNSVPDRKQTPPFHSSPFTPSSSSHRTSISSTDLSGYQSNSFSHSPFENRARGSFYKKRWIEFSQDPSNDRNPGGSSDIRDYVNPAMLKDPWEELQEQIKKMGYC